MDNGYSGQSVKKPNFICFVNVFSPKEKNDFSIFDNNNSSSSPDIIKPRQLIFENPLYCVLEGSNCAVITLIKQKINNNIFKKIIIKRLRFWRWVIR